MTKKPRKHYLEGLMALLLFGVFAVCLLAVLLTGANTYRGLTARDRAAYDRRVSVQYLAARVRQADKAAGVEVIDFGGGDALLLREGDYVTYVYVWDGFLLELYTAADNELAPGSGEEIMPAQDLAASLEDGLLRLCLTTADGQAVPLTLSLRSAAEEVTVS